MPGRFDPKTNILPPAQQEIWPLLAPARRLSFVLYGGTAVALHFGHRVSIDFDFFRTEPLNKQQIETSFQFMRVARTMQEDENTLVVSVPMPSGPVKVSMFGYRHWQDQRASSDQRWHSSRGFTRRSVGHETKGNFGSG